MTTRKKGLGKGLSALLGEDNKSGPYQANTQRGVHLVPVENLRAHPDQPRKNFDESELDALARSVETQGILQPLLVRPANEDGVHDIIAGERRWRAAQRARIHEVPVYIRDLDERVAREAMLIENVQRQDLNPMEEALGLKDLMDRYDYAQDQLASAIGKSRSHIANMLRLTKLPEELQDFLRNGQMTMGQARPLIGHERAVALAHLVVAKQLSVREVERLAKTDIPKPSIPKKNNKTKNKDGDTRALEADLSAALGLKVVVADAGRGRGELRIAYEDFEALDQLCGLLSEVGLKRR